ncbi:hypothetical protein IE53DRAFT_371793 [Violaceomyces palustris]|uniref:Uncharacterized protein n=1 Tax=Violaceomyces palustris TaxID=1673888 RepID=A0ACD0NMP4_9BASI|nr:hypothetical protein IE53DRAFT_371793 [Violaceomyces palustris]
MASSIPDTQGMDGLAVSITSISLDQRNSAKDEALRSESPTILLSPPSSAPAHQTDALHSEQISRSASCSSEPPRSHPSRNGSDLDVERTSLSLGPPLDDTLLGAIRNSRDRVFFMQHEREMAAMVNDSNRHTWELPLMNAYQRLLVHRCADQFQLIHQLDPLTKSVTLTRQACTKLPEVRLSQQALALIEKEFGSSPGTPGTPPASASGTSSSQTPPAGFRIMRRDPGSGSRSSLTQSTPVSASNSDSERSEVTGAGSSGRTRLKDRKHMTIEEREAAYKEARERIFGEMKDDKEKESEKDKEKEKGKDESKNGGQKHKPGKESSGKRVPSSSSSQYSPHDELDLTLGLGRGRASGNRLYPSVSAQSTQPSSHWVPQAQLINGPHDTMIAPGSQPLLGGSFIPQQYHPTMVQSPSPDQIVPLGPYGQNGPFSGQSSPGYPAQYGGGLSHQVDLGQRAGGPFPHGLPGINNYLRPGAPVFSPGHNDSAARTMDQSRPSPGHAASGWNAATESTGATMGLPSQRYQPHYQQQQQQGQQQHQQTAENLPGQGQQSLHQHGHGFFHQQGFQQSPGQWQQSQLHSQFSSMQIHGGDGSSFSPFPPSTPSSAGASRSASSSSGASNSGSGPALGNSNHWPWVNLPSPDGSLGATANPGYPYNGQMGGVANASPAFQRPGFPQSSHLSRETAQAPNFGVDQFPALPGSQPRAMAHSSSSSSSSSAAGVWNTNVGRSEIRTSPWNGAGLLGATSGTTGSSGGSLFDPNTPSASMSSSYRALQGTSSDGLNDATNLARISRENLSQVLVPSAQGPGCLGGGPLLSFGARSVANSHSGSNGTNGVRRAASTSSAASSVAGSSQGGASSHHAGAKISRPDQGQQLERNSFDISPRVSLAPERKLNPSFVASEAILVVFELVEHSTCSEWYLPFTFVTVAWGRAIASPFAS